MMNLMSSRTVCVAALLLAGALPQYAIGQSNNPERRGISLLPRAELPKLFSKHLKMARVGVPFDERRSLYVTDENILREFTLAATMDAIVLTSGDASLTKEDLFQQWWDTANDGKHSVGLGPACDSEKDGAGHSIKNGFTYACPRREGDQVRSQPFGNTGSDSYVAIALSNRFDLASDPRAGGTDCGEYRLVFAKRSGITEPTNRNLLIFEAVLPNPQPDGKTLDGCRPVQEFWAALSTIPSASLRAAPLRDFYFKGLPGFEPVVTAKHYGSATLSATGQIRTNQFMQSNWLLREFRTQSTAGKLKVMPVTVKTNPPAVLFDETDPNAQGSGFRAELLTQVANALAVNDINKFGYAVSDRFNSADSEAQGNSNSYEQAFGKSPQLASQIQARLTAAKSALTPTQVIARTQALSCAGCHELSNKANVGIKGRLWPDSLRFTHTSERVMESSPDGGNRFMVSNALKDVFLPARRQFLKDTFGL